MFDRRRALATGLIGTTAMLTPTVADAAAEPSAGGQPPGFYRLTVTLAQNNGATTPYHAVTNFQILQKPGHHFKKCAPGKVSSAKAAEKLE